MAKHALVQSPPTDTNGQKIDGRRNNGQNLKADTNNLGVQERTLAKGKIPSHLTKDAWRKMAEAGHDPLLMAIAIAQGRELTCDHPFLPWLLSFCEVLKDRINNEDGKQKPLTTEDIDCLMEKATEALTDSWVSHELRKQANKDLLDLIYPKAKADVHHSGSIRHDFNIKPLDAAEIRTIDGKFDADF